MMTVIDQASPWLMPRRPLAAITHPQLGAQIIMNGTGNPTSQPRTRTRLRPQESASWPEIRLANALITPKLTMKETMRVVDARWNSSDPISGTTVRSSPTMPPTKALITMSSANCCQFSFRPSLINELVVFADTASPMGSGCGGGEAGVGGAQCSGLWRRRWDLGEHEADERGLAVDAERPVVAPLEANGGDRVGAETTATDGSGVGAGKDLEIVGECFQLLHAPEQVLRALFGVDGKLGSTEIADHQRVAGEDEPRLLCPRAVAHQQADVLRRVAGRVQHFGHDVAKRQHFLVACSSEGEGHLGVRCKHILGAGRFGELPPRREVVGMDVGIDDEVDAHAGVFGRAQIWCDLAD